MKSAVRQCPRAARRQRIRCGERGIAMFEAMIAVLLLSISALAFAALQLGGLTSNTSAMWRSKAAQLTQEMAERMRANQAGVSGGSYNSLLVPGEAPACGVASACTSSQTAALDYATWSATIGNELPSGSGVICIDSTPDDGTADAPACDGAGTTFAVKVFWSERGDPSHLSMELRP
jgi:type IV pilus assembly protein PilV